MTKTFLYGLVVGLQPARGAVTLMVELESKKPSVPPLRRVELSRAVWQQLKKSRPVDEILVKRVAIDQQPACIAFIDALDVTTDVLYWWRAERIAS